MIVRKAFKFRLKPTRENVVKFLQFSGSCRFVWNHCLAGQKQRLDNEQYTVSYSKMNAEIQFLKSETQTSWLRTIHSQIVQQSLIHLDRAIKDAFDPKSDKKFPKFKKKNMSDSFSYPQGFKIDGSRVFLPKIGWVGFHKSREINGIMKNCTVSRRGKFWYVSIQTQISVEEPVHPSTTSVGIDVGIRKFASLSNNVVYDPINIYRRLQTKLAREQRRLSRKVKFSSNWQKQKQRITALHIRIADIRRDYLQKISTEISKNHAVICIEDLRVRNLSASAAGTLEAPGKNVAAKSGLNKAILDQGWFAFRTMLGYKQEWRGGTLVPINPKNTSRKCSVCGHTCAENRRRDRFRCVECGHKSDADINAAINILAVGQTVLACGDLMLVESAKQELPENSGTNLGVAV